MPSPSPAAEVVAQLRRLLVRQQKGVNDPLDRRPSMQPKPLSNSSTRCIRLLLLLLLFYPRPVAAKPRPTPLLQPNVSPGRPRGGARGRGGGQRVQSAVGHQQRADYADRS